MTKRSLFSIIVAIFILALTTSACIPFYIPFHNSNPDFKSITPSGNIITETRSVSGFNRVDVSTFGKLTIIQGETEGLVIEADDNLMPYIEARVSGDKLSISNKDNLSLNIRVNDPNPTLQYTLTVKDLKSLSISGLASLGCDSLETEDLTILVSGSGNIRIYHLSADTLSVEISGLGDVSLEGQVSNQKVNISGAGRYLGGDLRSATATVNLSGLGDATMWVTDNLDVTISGTGSINYFGRPTISQEVSGLGRLNSLGEH